MPTITKPKKRPQTGRNLNAEERAKIYRTARWRRLREAKLMTDPLCEICGEVAEDVHHKISFMETTNTDHRYALAFDYDNLQSVCKQCHQKIHNYGKKSL